MFGALSAAAWSAETLIGFRTVSAIFGSAAGPAGIAIISTQFEAGQRIRVMGWWALVMAGGPVAGIIVGGPVIDIYSWRWLFVAQIPLTLIALVAAALVFPDTERKDDVRFDVPGTALLAAAVSLLLFGSNRGPIWGWGSGSLVVCLVTSGLLLAGFVLTPLFLAEVFDYSTTRTSYLVTSRPLFFALAGPVVGFVGQRLGERILATSGAALVAVSSLLLAFVGVGTSDLFIFSALGLAGFGLGMTMPAMTAAVTNSVDDADIATAGKLRGRFRRLGDHRVGGNAAGLDGAAHLSAARSC